MSPIVQETQAHPIWLVLAGQGFWGALFTGIVGILYALTRPAILAWMQERRLSKFYLAAEAAVAKNNAIYTEGMKAANADGKLTQDEANYVFNQCKKNLVDYMEKDGRDIIKEYGEAFIDGVIELIVSQLKNPFAKAVTVPLSSFSVSAPLPPSVAEGAMLDWTNGASGLTTPAQVPAPVSAPSPTN